MKLSRLHRVRVRALLSLLACAAGSVLARRWAQGEIIDSITWFAAACGCLAIGLFIGSRWRGVVYVLVVFLLAGGWTQFRLVEPEVDRFDQVIEQSLEASRGMQDSEAVLVEVRGMIIESARTRHREPNAWDPPTWSDTQTAATLMVDSVQIGNDDVDEGRKSWITTGGMIRLVMTGDAFADSDRPCQSGERVQVFGRYHPIGTQRNIGEPNWQELAIQAGRVGSVVVSGESMINQIEHASWTDRMKGRWVYGRSWMRQRALGALGLGAQEHAGSPRRAMVGALLLGERDPEFGEVYRTFQRVGVAHVLAISGFHLGLVVLMLMVCVRLLGSMPKVELVLIVGVLVVGMLLVPMRPPIVRAGVIVLSMLLAGGAGRRYDRLTVLSWVGVGLIIWRPMDVSSLGYQLSMGITGVLVLVSIHRQGKPGQRHAHNDQLASRWIETWRWVRGWFVGALKLNVLCWAVAMPVIVYHTGIASMLAPLASVVLVPMIGVLMALGYLQVLIGMISPQLGAQTIGMIDVPAMLVEGIAVRTDGLGYSSMTIGIISGWLCGLTSLMAAIIGTRLVHWRDRRAWVICGVLGVWWIGALGAWGIVREGIGIDAVAMRVDMLDVQDGSCLIVQADGEAMLWDCGSLDWRVGSMVERAARHAGVVGRVKFAIITHDNIDHFNGLIDCSRSLGIEQVYVSKTMFDDGSYAWRTMRDQLELRGIEIIEIQRGDVLQLGNATLTCLWPDPDFMAALNDELNEEKSDEKNEAMSENNQSVVVRIETIGNQSILLCGDIEHEAIEAIEILEPGLKADVIELPHHGSRRTGSVGFVESLSPRVVLQSTGPSRSGMSYWDGLKDQSRWYTTADHGGVWVEINHDGTIERGSVLDD